jgi:phospho-N-acetylmuramoyl-pentapeptide-transferase
MDLFPTGDYLNMLYYLFYRFHDGLSALNIFRYITFRAAMAALTAFLLSLILGPKIINMLKRQKIGENVRKQDSVKLDDLHRDKQDTPTMGGVFVLAAIFIATLLWSEVLNKNILIALLVTFWLGLTGFADDYLKQVRKRPKGLSARQKLLSQLLVGLIAGVLLFSDGQYGSKLDVPFLKAVSIDLGIFYICFAALVITGSSNAVNLTDGLDGLAIGNVVLAAVTLGVLSYVSGHLRFSSYLYIPYIRGSGELTVFCAAILGAGLGFLWYNCYPASVFMGDVGSLALGGALGTVALLIKKELLLVVIGGVFVIEALSVILQVASFKLTGKRIFKIAPLHHHFQFVGWPESKVIVRFWIVASLLALLTLVTLKIR